ncbi:MAG: hypothetical protein SPJ27_06660 [Candidatus Onthovivens sp.]|nr:hypothetical protein [Candidatus Onthovivens sp.]
MDKEMLDILNVLSKKPTTELALQIMELSSENLILEQQCKKQKEVIDKAVNDIQEIIDAVNKNTIIVMKQFNFKLEIIQDELSGSNDILKEVE